MESVKDKDNSSFKGFTYEKLAHMAAAHDQPDPKSSGGYSKIYNGHGFTCAQANNKFMILNIDDISMPTHPVYKFHWYEDAALDIDRLLQEKATSLRGVSVLSDTAAPKTPEADDAVVRGKETESMNAISEQVGQLTVKKQTPSPEEPATPRADFYVHYTITGTRSTGKSLFIRYFLDRLCRNKAAQDRPDVLLVYRMLGIEHEEMKAGEEIVVELLYCAADGVSQSVLKTGRLPHIISDLFSSPGQLHRPLYVVVDSLDYKVVLAGLHLAGMTEQLCLLLCVASSCCKQAGTSIGGIFDYARNEHVRHVADLSFDDYFACGYVCATRHTRLFLRDAAGITNVAKDVDAVRGALKAGTPQEVQEVMRYAFAVVGGSARWLLRLGMRGRRPNYATILCVRTALIEALGAGSEGQREMRIKVNTMVAELVAIGDELTPPRKAALHYTSLLSREIEINEDGILRYRMVPATAALAYVSLELQHKKVLNVYTALGTAFGASDADYFFKQLPLPASFRELKQKGSVVLKRVRHKKTATPCTR